MPLDHYVSQVHLKNFYSPDLGKRMYAIRKRDLLQFECKSDDVCRIKDGSTNAYLIHDRAIEDFLKEIEPKYNKSIEKLRRGQPDKECIFTISGFVAYVSSCSPAGMRIHSASLKTAVETSGILLDQQGNIPSPPPELGGKNYTELLETGKIQVEIDSKYPQAIGIGNIFDLLSTLGNFSWEILANTYTDSQFFTSDYPIALEKTSDPNITNKIVPLAPDLAIRILPNIFIDKTKFTLDFIHHSFKLKKPPRKEVRKINQLIVRCAEELVFLKDNHDWVKNFISKNNNYRIETHTERIKANKGFYILAQQRICEVKNF